MRHAVRFLRNGRMVELAAVKPMDTLLDYLRIKERAIGTKEGCCEGDCGACTVVLGRLCDGQIHYAPFNSCILLMGQVDGAEVIAVDDLAEGEKGLHPVQEAMVRNHASQCGFCTPGFVMSLFALYHSGVRATRPVVNDWLAGNLCRCTGYRPIVDAALESCIGNPSDVWKARQPQTVAALTSLGLGEEVFIGTPENFLAIPASVESLASLYATHPDAVLVAGATDVALWITKQLRNLQKVIFLHRAGLSAIEETDRNIIFGATVTYEQAESSLARIDRDLLNLLRRLGSKQVRASGTLGGNIANGSPIGDMPPALIALGSTIELRKGEVTREIPLEEFFIGYGKQDRSPGEFVVRLIVPKLEEDQAFRCYKIAKRFDQDISSVMGAFLLTLRGGRIHTARIAFGGMAATPKRAQAAERALAGASLGDMLGWTAALDALTSDYQPIDDHRASASYRVATARALLKRALVEVSGRRSDEMRIAGTREEELGRILA